MIFLETPPIKTAAPHDVHRPLKIEAPSSEKQTPHWNVENPSMRWFLEKAQ